MLPWIKPVASHQQGQHSTTPPVGIDSGDLLTSLSHLLFCGISNILEIVCKLNYGSFSPRHKIE